MKIIKEIFEEYWIKEFLIKRKLLLQYLKSINMIINWNYGNLDFKLRKPKKDKIYSFRINKQFRAFWYFKEEWLFIVVEINNHSSF